MRSIWKGAMGFGLVNIPIKLYSATSSKRLRFNQLHRVCGNRIRYRKWCPVCDREVAPEEIVRGYEYTRGRYIVLEEEEFENLPINTDKVIEILDFVDLEDIDPVYFDSSYFLEPDRGGEKAYRLLLEAMKVRGRIAVAKVALRNRESLAAVRGYSDSALIMETIFYPDEIRSVEELPGLYTDPVIQDRELELAVNIIDNLSTDFEPGRYTDEYREALEEVINMKLEGREITQVAEEPRAPVIDLMEALQKSLEATEKEPRRRQTQG